MKLSTYFLILSRQISRKWGRFLLASGGIMIGVWAVMLTSGLTFGVRSTLVDAINSRPESRFIQIQKTDGVEFSFDINDIPKFKGISNQDLENLKDQSPSIVSTLPSLKMDLEITAGEIDNAFSCTEVSRLTDNLLPLLNRTGITDLNITETQFDQLLLDPTAASILEGRTYFDLINSRKQYLENCSGYTITATDFNYLLDTTRTYWTGKTENFAEDEIVVCFVCGNNKLNEKFNAQNPEDLIGETISFEYKNAPTQYVFGEQVYDIFSRDLSKPQEVPINNKFSYKIAAVIDDRETILSLGFSNFYLPRQDFERAIELANPESIDEDVRFIEYSLFVDDYTSLQSTSEEAIRQGFEATAIALILVNSINGLFIGVSVVLILFSLIAFVASTFGIVSIMTISVLERKKEIGILKALGARDGSIFGIFFVETIFLGILGWILGIILGYASGLIIETAFNLVVSQADIAQSLKFFNIDSFSPVYPWYVFVITFVISIVFTAFSGLVPSINAARQDPVDVLRGE
jgi:hypothetical protein